MTDSSMRATINVGQPPTHPFEVVQVYSTDSYTNQAEAAVMHIANVYLVGPWALRRLALRAGHEMTVRESLTLIVLAQAVHTAVTNTWQPPAGRGKRLSQVARERQARRSARRRAHHA